jgi:hypothetical protein
MTQLPISSFEDMQELSRAMDRVRHAKENRTLQEAGTLAEIYFKKGKKEIGNRILKLAGDMFVQKEGTYVI